jgi:hypothetical protein
MKKRATRQNYPMVRDRYELRDHKTRRALSRHPNVVGAQLSALFHVPNGASLTWDTPGPAQGMRGYTNGRVQFFVEPIGERT